MGVSPAFPDASLPLQALYVGRLGWGVARKRGER